jgi:hypothetical protein
VNEPDTKGNAEDERCLPPVPPARHK